MNPPNPNNHSTPIIHEYITAADEDITADASLIPSAENRAQCGNLSSSAAEFVSWFERWIAPQPKSDNAD